jgi:hypothetical protein
MGKHTIVLEPPPPLAVRPGPCEFPALLRKLTPKDRRDGIQHNCRIPALRRVQVGLVARADVCLWHSLVTTERLHGHLIRDLPT